MAEDKSLEKELAALEEKGASNVGLTDQRVVPAIFLLTKALLRLDKTGSNLAKIYIWLTLVLVLSTGKRARH